MNFMLERGLEAAQDFLPPTLRREVERAVRERPGAMELILGINSPDGYQSKELAYLMLYATRETTDVARA